MKNTTTKATIICICLSIILVSSYSAAAEPNSRVNEISPDGKQLYAKHCAHCHKSLENTTKPNRSTKRLRSAINHFPEMNKLSFLTDEEIDAIVQEMKDPHKGK